jgi:osmotically-inducible protein OsmY
MKKILIISTLLISLSACVPAAFVAGATAGGAVVYENRPIKTIWQDQNITHRAQLRISTDKELMNRTNISIATFNHIVLLVGQVPTEQSRSHAVEIIKDIPNIRRICNQILIKPPISAAARSKDIWITTKIKAAMLEKEGLHSTQIKVVTEDGVAYLMGLTTPTQGKLAADTARKIKGVKKVVKLFEYVH